MSVNITVASTRSGSGRWRVPVMNSSISSAMTSCVALSVTVWSVPGISAYFAPGMCSAR